MVKTTRAQRESLFRIWTREREAVARYPALSYRRFRAYVRPGPGCIMVPFAGMWLGIEPDGYTHS